MKLYCTEFLLVLLLAITIDSSVAEIQRGDITVVSSRSLEVDVVKSRTSRQAQFQPQFMPHAPQCLPPPAPFEGKACTASSECDGSNTVLSCERGACTCPNRPALKWKRGPYDLNTAWDSELKKCVSLKDSACDIYKPKTVHCQKGLVCHEKTKNYGFGLCSTSGAVSNPLAITTKILVALSFSILSSSFI